MDESDPIVFKKEVVILNALKKTNGVPVILDDGEWN